MSEENQYAPPSSDLSAPPPIRQGGENMITEHMVESLKATKPWVRFLSILGFIASFFMFIAGLGIAVVGGLAGEFGGIVGGVAIAFFYIFIGLIYIYPSLLLFRYASAIQRMLAGGNVPAMEEALQTQKRFWKFCGIFTIVVLVIYFFVLIAAIMIPTFAALTS